VFAFEASPWIQPRLRAVLSNPIGNIGILPYACWDAATELTFYCETSGHSGKSSVRPADENFREAVKVPARDIDSLSGLGTVHLIKVDVEGAELHVLRGARQLLKRDLPILILEVTDSYLRSMGGSARELVDFTVDLGYHGYRIDGTDLCPLESLEGEQFDALFVATNEQWIACGGKAGELS
jgi:FkbM family methyltransferase